jgi:hypothetical protein
MKVNYSELMKKLGVGRDLNVYETQPWLTYDEVTNMTCEAEVRCNHDKTLIEAEMQFMPDTPIAGKPPVEQICIIRCEKYKREANEYALTSCVIRDKEWAGEFYDWETQACAFFRACVTEIRKDNIPDIDKILEREMKDKSRYNSGQGDGSNKQPKINASQLMYDRKGIGAGF